MMSWIVATSLRLRVLVVALAVLLTIVGIRTAQQTAFDVFPEFAPPLVEIQTEAPGLSTEEVESLVTVPVENALHGAPWVKTIRSKSVLGLSSVVLIFDPGTDLLRGRQVVQERLAVEAARLPNIAHAPVMLPPLSSTSRALKIGLSSKTLSQMELTELAKWTIRPRLMAVQGVANVAIWGQRDRQYQVLVDPARLRANELTLDTVTRAASDAVVISGGGFIDSPNQRLAIRHLAPVVEADDLARTVVDFRNGAPIRLGDVAEVRVDHPAPIGDAVINDGPGLLLIVEKQPWGNTLSVTRQVESALDDLKPGLKDVEVDSTIFRPATFIERSLTNLQHALLLGCVLVVAILVAFFFEWRAAVISLVTIPLSLLAAGIVLHYMGGTINTMVLAGLVIAVGVVVDDAIIDVENIARRLRQWRLAQAEVATHPLSPSLSPTGEKRAPKASEGEQTSIFRAVLDASLEVRSAVVLASFIVTLVFVPVFFLPGLAGSFFRPLALAYVLAILASMVVALTLTPALALMLLPKAAERARSPLSQALQQRYRALLPRIVSRPGLAMLVLVGAFAATGIALPWLGEEFLPNFKETDFLMHWVEKPGTSLDAMRRITERASRELRAIPGVRNFGSHIGRAEVADEVVGPNFTELWLSIEPTADYGPTVHKIQEVVDGYPGLYRDVLTYLKERIKEVLTGASATIVVRIFGPDMDLLRHKAKEVAAVMEKVPGVTHLKIEPQVLVPQVTVRLRPEAAEQFGLTPGQVRRATTTLVQGAKVGEVYHQQRAYGVTVWGAEAVRRDVHAVGDLLIDASNGAQVPLRDVAEIAIQPTPNEIKREGASRRLDVTCNAEGRDLGSVAREIEQGVRALSFDRGYHPEFLGEYAARQESQRQLLLLTALAVLGILVLLHVEFRSWRLTWLVFLTLPFALIGGVLGAFLSGGVLSLGSLVGFVTVLGVAARNGIMLLSHYQHLQFIEGEAFGTALIVRGAEERLAPILMTALCAGLGLVPLVLAGNKPGYEIEYPMAAVILGGLITSTVLNLVLMPALYGKFGRLTKMA
jgi:CzcA family heavy metal efflux pump